MVKGMLVLLCAVIIFAPAIYAQESPVYKDSKAPVERRVEDLLSRLTLEEKIDMIGGYSSFYIRPNDSLGIPSIKMADGPLGVRNYGQATAFPGGIAFAATWNQTLVNEYGKSVGREARARGVHIMLSPGVNIQRSPLCGRNFEYYGEDPYLASRMVVGYVTGVQSQGVIATAKHFAGNNQEWDRNRISSEIDERTLREIYLPTFRAAVEEAKIGAIMTAYNLVNGTYCSENEHLIKEIVKGDWKFDGIVMSDWGATHSTVASANAGLDLEMPSARYMNRTNLIPAIQDGSVQIATLDDKIRRILRITFRMGWFDRPQLDSTIALDNPDSRLIALQGAREGIVLLKNKGNVLPLDRSKITSIAVLGPNAHPAVTGGGGSSMVRPFRSVSPLDGITASAGNKIKVLHSPGIVRDVVQIAQNAVFSTKSETGQVISGLKGEYFSNINFSGQPVLTRIDEHINFNWPGAPEQSLPADSFSIRWTGTMTASADGEYEFIARGDDGFRLYIDNKIIMDAWTNQSGVIKIIALPLQKGKSYEIKLEHYDLRRTAQIVFGWRKKPSPLELEPVRLASTANAAIVCVGFNSQTESEGRDRTFALPSDQEELIKEVAKVNKNTIVVITAGGNIAMTGWINNIAGLLHSWYSGQEGGTAIAEILFGDINPSGKLPISCEKKWEDNPCYPYYYDTDNDRKTEYKEGVFIGYRYYDTKNVEPLFPFGFGLSYTTFKYKNLTVSPAQITANQKVTVSLDVTNTGTRAGAEAVQLYIRDNVSSIPRPAKELKAFDKVLLKPGETKRVTFTLDATALSFYSVAKKGWVAEPGEFEVQVGSSSRDIRLKKVFTLK